MSHDIKYHSVWLNHDGDLISIDNVVCQVKVRVVNAIYPYKHTAIYVDADPVDKEDPKYLETKRQLNDDWSIDILSMDPDKIVSLLETGEC
jgi:hypothetical protein